MENAGAHHLHRRLPLPHPATDAGARDRADVIAARDGPHVVRRPGDHALVGRPVAERVVRLVPVHVHDGHGHPTRDCVDDLRPDREGVGLLGWINSRRRTRSRRMSQTLFATMLNMDGSSYSKGAGTLKQLVAWVGLEPFRPRPAALHQGQRVREHVDPGPARRAGGRQRSGSPRMGARMAADRRCLDPRVGADRRRPRAYRIVRGPPVGAARQPDASLASDRVGTFDRDGAGMARTRGVEVDVVGARTDIPDLVGLVRPGPDRPQRRRPDLGTDATGRPVAAGRPRRGDPLDRRAAHPGGPVAGAPGDDPRRDPAGRRLRPDRAGRAAIRARDHDDGGPAASHPDRDHPSWRSRASGGAAKCARGPIDRLARGRSGGQRRPARPRAGARPERRRRPPRRAAGRLAQRPSRPGGLDHRPGAALGDRRPAGGHRPGRWRGDRCRVRRRPDRVRGHRGRDGPGEPPDRRRKGGGLGVRPRAGATVAGRAQGHGGSVLASGARRPMPAIRRALHPGGRGALGWVVPVGGSESCLAGSSRRSWSRRRRPS